MKPVTQTRGYVDDERRGNCFPACIASIFELPLSAVPRSERRLDDWLDRTYPGVTVERTHWQRPHPKYPFEYLPTFLELPPYHPGYWIATVESFRFRTRCSRCSGVGKTQVILDEQTHRKRRMNCVVCKGSGRVQGLHAVVMRGSNLAWDPSPGRDQGFGRFHGETLLLLSEPARLTNGAAQGSQHG